VSEQILPRLDVLLVVHLGEYLDLDDLEVEVSVPELPCRVLRLTDLLDALLTQLCDCAHYF